MNIDILSQDQVEVISYRTSYLVNKGWVLEWFPYAPYNRWIKKGFVYIDEYDCNNTSDHFSLNDAYFLK